MREFALSVGLKRLFSCAAVVAVTCAMLMLSGCGHKCGCQRSNGCNTCNTCNAVSDASTPSNNVCTTCQQGGAYDRVGTAPPTLSEGSGASYSSAPSPYSSGTTYSGTNASLDRVGGELPLFSAPAPAPVQAVAVQPIQPTVQQAALVPQDQPVRGGGQYHTLAQGETVYALSRKYGVKAKAILDANHFSDPNHLAIGTKIYIPNN